MSSEQSGVIAAGKAVSMSYRLLDGDGRVLEERTPEAPAIFTQGAQEVLPAIERALEGQRAGFRTTLRLPPGQAYGEYDPSLLAEVERSRFAPGTDLQPGAKFSTKGPDGRPVTVRVLEADDDTVSLDGNHPLAGLELVFELNVLEVGDGPGDLDGAGSGPGSNGGRGALH